MWYQLLLMDCFDDETSAKKHKKKMETRKESGDTAISQWKLSAVLQQIRKDIVPVILMLPVHASCLHSGLT